MKSALAALFVTSTFSIVTPLVSAQIVGAYYPVEVGPPPTVVVGESYVVHRPVITYSQVVESPMVTAYRPSVVVGPIYGSPRTVYRVYTPQVVTYRPVITTYRPVITTYRPVVTTHHPVVTTYRPVGPTVVYPRTVVVRPKVYVRGQPVRNVLRAITP